MTDAIDEVIAEPETSTLDRVLMNAPSEVTDAMLDSVIATLRKDRLLFIQKEAGGKTDDEAPGPAQQAASALEADTPQD